MFYVEIDIFYLNFGCHFKYSIKILYLIGEKWLIYFTKNKLFQLDKQHLQVKR